jgi:hypothetical protein
LFASTHLEAQAEYGMAGNGHDDSDVRPDLGIDFGRIRD